MARKKTAVITIETHQLTVVHTRGSKQVQLWCPACAAEVEMLTALQAANQTGMSIRQVYRRIEDGSLHFVESEAGALLICCRAL